MTVQHRVGYCTNVHAGSNLSDTKTNLQRHAVGVKQRFRPDEPLGIGLWLSAASAAALREGNQLEAFADWLADAGLQPYTLNGFPYGDFHQAVVKHDVYKPTWAEKPRVDFTLDLIEILHALLPTGAVGSISTLPLQWGTPRATEAELQASAENLRTIATRLSRLESETGRLIHVCIEPEPGCVFQRSTDIVGFYENVLLPAGDEQPIRRHLRVCHDVCHAAVMFEGQGEALRRYAAAGIAVGKVQVSSAIVVPFEDIEPVRRGEAVAQLRAFAEDRYLHQTMIQAAPLGPPVFFEDLPAALRLIDDPAELTGQWRIHFHVPVYLEEFGLLKTSRKDIANCLTASQQLPELPHFEVETYAWGVLPEELQQPTLADGIAAELQWFDELIGPVGG